MLEAIAALGKRELNRRKEQDEIDLLLVEPNATHVLALTFDNDPLAYRGVEVAECDKQKTKEYFLTPGPSNGALFSPTAMITEPDKTFNMRFVGWVNKVRKNADRIGEELAPDQRDWLENFLTEFERTREKMENDFISRAKESAGKRNRLMATVRIRHDGHTQWVGDKTLPFRTIFRVMQKEDVYSKSSGKGACSVCAENTAVSGRIGSEVFPFATFDKPGFIAGGFDQDLTWRNLPICEKCHLVLKLGREYVEKKMTFRFSGIQYWLVPRFMTDIERNQEALRTIEYWEHRQGLGEQATRGITGDEDDILKMLSEQKDFMTLNFIFLERSNSMERVLLLASDILPSRLNRIIKAKEFVDEVRFLENGNIGFHFGRLRPFFARVKGGGREDIELKPFLSVIGSILRGQQLNRETLMAAMMRRIRQDIANMRTLRSASWVVGASSTWAGDYFGRGGGKTQSASDGKANGHATRADSIWITPTEAWMSLTFLDRLGILSNNRKGMKTMDGPIIYGSEFARQMDDVFSRYEGTFYNDATKAAFMLGSLSQMLLDVQYQDRKATPFLKHLKGLRLTARDLRELLPKIQNKLQEYDSFTLSRRKTAGAASDFMMRSDDQLRSMTPDEASFYFVLGMNLVQVVWEQARPQTEERFNKTQDEEQQA